jgi:hypothetical protein
MGVGQVSTVVAFAVVDPNTHVDPRRPPRHPQPNVRGLLLGPGNAAHARVFHRPNPYKFSPGCMARECRSDRPLRQGSGITSQFERRRQRPRGHDGDGSHPPAERQGNHDQHAREPHPNLSPHAASTIATEQPELTSAVLRAQDHNRG